MNPYLLAAFGYAVVFLVLLSLYLIFQNLPKLLGSITRVEQEAKKMVLAAQENFGNGHSPPPPEKTSQAVLTGEVNAAIATALYLYLNEAHDEEDLRLTIQQISRRYSPWSSKIYGVSNQPIGKLSLKR